MLSQIIASLPGDKKRAEQLLKRLEENKKMADWKWLVSKANALKDK